MLMGIFYKTPIFKSKKIIIVGVVGYITVYVLVIVFHSSALMQFVAELVGKSSTFTNRVGIWDKALVAVLQSPLLGRGQMGDNDLIKMLGYTGAHNKLLQIMLDKGIVGVLIFLYVMYLDLKGVYMHYSEPQNRYLFCAFVALNIFWLTEGYTDFLLSFVIILSYYTSNGKYLLRREGDRDSVLLRGY